MEKIYKDGKICEQNAIITQTMAFASLCSGRQKSFYEKMLSDFMPIKCSNIEDVFTEQEFMKILRYVRPKAKECYRNAHLLTALFPERVQYIEGQVAVLNGCLVVDHAWNVVDGKYYIDTTFEIALQENPTELLYMSLGCYNFDTITQIASQTGYYGSIYNQIFINSFKETNL